MRIIKNEICIGIDKPFTFLHMTDTHFVFVDEEEREARKELSLSRKKIFPNGESNADFVRDYVAKTGYPLVHTGDLMDFITSKNLLVVQEFAKETNMLMVAGNHELHTCPNNAFREDDFTIDLEHREERLDLVQKWFYNDIRFFCKEINGVNLVGIDDSDYQISSAHLEKLKSIVAFGKPIILFMHIPPYTEEIFSKIKTAMLAVPDEIVQTYRPWNVFEQQANDVTKQAYDYIVHQPLIKCIFGGHLHFDYETRSETDVKQFITGIDTLREITIV